MREKAAPCDQIPQKREALVTLVLKKTDIFAKITVFSQENLKAIELITILLWLKKNHLERKGFEGHARVTVSVM